MTSPQKPFDLLLSDVIDTDIFYEEHERDVEPVQLDLIEEE